ncbi:TraV family lipoprotein [Hyphomonas sp.]|uniref:TraV family lipoprotein n=1 Tax=Hyphomonas sp. TaxID=87 RepID=UPI00262C6452|nr:TraV family lipoprotein [Hyphomonas sp.]MDF1805783.1 TraV family lipoprotein [Hyphomonas sp.]
MIVTRLIMIASAAAMMSGCSVLRGSSSVSGDWSCRAIGVSACQSIAHNDITNNRDAVTGSQVVQAVPTMPGVYGSDRPTLYGRHVMRVSIAAWVDEDGRYHAPSTVFAPTGDEIWGVPVQDAEAR